MMKKITAFLLIAFLAFAAPVVQAEPAAAPELPRSEASLAMEEYLEGDHELMALMEKSIASAAQVNPDLNTNPVRSVDEEFLCETEGDGYAHILMGEPYANLTRK